MNAPTTPKEMIAHLQRENAALRRHSADQGLTLATLCDLILGEAADDRSDTALIRGASVLVRGRDEVLHKMQQLRNEVARLNGQTMWVCTCGGTDCAGQKENAALKIEINRLRCALLDCSDAAIGGSTLAEWIRGKVAATLGKEAQP